MAKIIQVGLDVDGVIANFVEAFKRFARRRFDVPDINYLPYDWDWTDSGLTPEEITKVWEDIKHTPNFWIDEIRILPDTDLLYKLFTDKRFDLTFISARVPTRGLPVVHQTEEWLRDRYDLIQPFVIISDEKGKLVNELGIDFFIDDKVENYLDIKRDAPGCKVYLKKASHNKSFWDKLDTVENLNEFIGIVIGAK